MPDRWVRPPAKAAKRTGSPLERMVAASRRCIDRRRGSLRCRAIPSSVHWDYDTSSATEHEYTREVQVEVCLDASLPDSRPAITASRVVLLHEVHVRGIDRTLILQRDRCAGCSHDPNRIVVGVPDFHVVMHATPRQHPRPARIVVHLEQRPPEVIAHC
jgi:hypothetical protein